MSDDWVSADEGPTQAAQPKGLWTVTQKSVIRTFADEWNADGADRNVILPTIVAALLALSEPPIMPNMGSVCRDSAFQRYCTDCSHLASERLPSKQLSATEGNQSRQEAKRPSSHPVHPEEGS